MCSHLYPEKLLIVVYPHTQDFAILLYTFVFVPSLELLLCLSAITVNHQSFSFTHVDMSVRTTTVSAEFLMKLTRHSSDVSKSLNTQKFASNPQTCRFISRLILCFSWILMFKIIIINYYHKPNIEQFIATECNLFFYILHWLWNKTWPWVTATTKKLFIFPITPWPESRYFS